MQSLKICFSFLFSLLLTTFIYNTRIVVLREIKILFWEMTPKTVNKESICKACLMLSFSSFLNQRYSNYCHFGLNEVWQKEERSLTQLTVRLSSTWWIQPSTMRASRRGKLLGLCYLFRCSASSSLSTCFLLSATLPKSTITRPSCSMPE